MTIASVEKEAPLLFSEWRPILAIVAGLSLLILCASFAQDLRLYTGQKPDLSTKIWLLDVDVERSVFTWVSVLVLFFCSRLLFQCGDDAAGRSSQFTWHWYFLGFLFLFLCFDEFAGLHEKLSSALAARSTNTGLLYFAWAAPAGILSLVGLAAFVPFIRSFPTSLAVLLAVSAALFLGGAVGLEMVGGSVAEAEGVESLRYRMLANIEEGLELAGTLTFIYALFSYREITSRAR
ncbi:hypothetical protein [Mesorhizobium tianshanense]|uniref:hypothetical protein n=1 Tax=Mesorhizobium tianshanense TaxID=39844 RepID=UPI0011A34543|nr:hypothetical protein [Mesorhizobium tianshanense]